MNAIVTQQQAAAFLNAGFRFALRYVGRELMDAEKDLSAKEAEMLLKMGFALMPVQHVQRDHGWMPTADLGTLYGTNAAKFAQQIGFPQGVNVWLDLEGVSRSAPAEDVDAYCRNWYAAVAAARYVPG
ncbi:MAG TPA: glycoside hydrolase domain-containing protein, partial [Longimicrobium sp.]|nr:glycoside hydrolase domain-containing protein [Longimicrobium sp.]